MKKVIRLTESDLVRIIKRVIKEDFDYNEITEDFYKIRDILIDMANNGEFILRVVDERNPTNDTYGEGENESFSNDKKKVLVKILQPMNMVISSLERGNNRYFTRDFISLLYDRLRNQFPEMYITVDVENGYIQIRPKKYVKQGFYGNLANS